MMLTYHISLEKNFSAALSVPGRSGVNLPILTNMHEYANI